MSFSFPNLCSHLPCRSDGEQSRERLLKAGLRLFAEQGFAKTSVRQLAAAAQTNVAAVNYYFGDKAGLYRTIFRGPCSLVDLAALPEGNETLSLDAFLQQLYGNFLSLLKQDAEIRLVMQLHRREMLEPTGLWEEKINDDIKPLQAALLVQLSRHLHVTTIDDDLRRLAIAISSLAVNLLVSYEVIEAIAPQLTANDVAIDQWTERLVGYAQAMISAEAQRRTHPIST